MFTFSVFYLILREFSCLHVLMAFQNLCFEFSNEKRICIMPRCQRHCSIRTAFLRGWVNHRVYKMLKRYMALQWVAQFFTRVGFQGVALFRGTYFTGFFKLLKKKSQMCPEGILFLSNGLCFLSSLFWKVCLYFVISVDHCFKNISLNTVYDDYENLLLTALKCFRALQL